MSPSIFFPDQNERRVPPQTFRSPLPSPLDPLSASSVLRNFKKKTKTIKQTKQNEFPYFPSIQSPETIKLAQMAPNGARRIVFLLIQTLPTFWATWIWILRISIFEMFWIPNFWISRFPDFQNLVRAGLEPGRA